MFALYEEKDYGQDRACYIQVQGHMEWVGFGFFAPHRPPSVSLLFVPQGESHGQAGLASSSENLHLKLATALTREPIELSGDS